MLQVKNETPFTPAMFLFPDLSGVDTLYVVLQGTFTIGKKGISVAEQQLPIPPGDVHWGDPAQSSVRYAGEAHPGKPAADVVLVGAAHAPGGRPAPSFGASMSVGKLKKVVQVSGDRVWAGGILGQVPSDPVPAASVPLTFERAYGGRHDLEGGRFLAEMRNPVGVGFRGKRGNAEMKGTPVPNVEDPRHPIRSASDAPPPAGFGYVAPSWLPRALLAGTYDEAWRKKRAPYFPSDIDPRFFQAVSPDQIYPGHLVGGEPVELINLAPEGVQRFALPTCRVDVDVRIAGEVVSPRLRIETLLLEPDQGRFSLVWRGAVPCDKRTLRVEEARFELGALEGVES
jgi:hypothetical protein